MDRGYLLVCFVLYIVFEKEAEAVLWLSEEAVGMIGTRKFTV